MMRCGAQEMKFYLLRKSGTSRLHGVSLIIKNLNIVPVGWVEGERHLFVFVEEMMSCHETLIRRGIAKPNTPNGVGIIVRWVSLGFW